MTIAIIYSTLYLYCPLRWAEVMHRPGYWSKVALIAVHCLVFMSLGPKGNNGVMGKILQAVTSFGFRMYSTGLIEGLCGVCLCICGPAPLVTEELSEFVVMHHLFFIHSTLYCEIGQLTLGHLYPMLYSSPFHLSVHATDC